MSLVSRYARRDEDDEEEAPKPEKMVITEEEAKKKKRDAEDEVVAPEPKKAKLSEDKDEKLELPDFFKGDTTPKSVPLSTTTSKTTSTESKPAKLIPRQVRYVTTPFLYFYVLSN